MISYRLPILASRLACAFLLLACTSQADEPKSEQVGPESAGSQVIQALKACTPIDVLITDIRIQSKPVVSKQGTQVEDSDPVAKAETRAWLIVRARAYIVPEGKLHANGEPPLRRPIFTAEQFAALDAQIATNTERGIELADGVSNHDVFRRIAANNRAGMNTVIPEVMLFAVRMHPLFSSNIQETRFISFRPDDRVKNMTDFEFQIRLKTPLTSPLFEMPSELKD